MDDEGSKRWTQKLLLIGTLGTGAHPRAEKKLPDLKSRQIDHQIFALDNVCKAFNGILIIICNQ